jgi:hypothetical protein
LAPGGDGAKMKFAEEDSIETMTSSMDVSSCEVHDGQHTGPEDVFGEAGQSA